MIIVIIILILSGGILWWQLQKENNLKIAKCEEKSTTLEKDQCYIAVAQTSKRPELCERTFGPPPTPVFISLRDECYNSVAVTSGLWDVDLCKKIKKDNNLRNSCINSIAFARKDINLCNKHDDTEEKNYCINHFETVLNKLK